MKNKKLQALVEEMLGAAAAEPVHGDEAAKEHTPELSNKDVLVGQHAEEVEEVIVEGEDMDGEESHVDKGEYDYEGDMAKSQLRTILDAAQELHDQLGDEDNLPEWVQSKITLAKEYIDTARDYMKSEGQESVQESYTEEELVELFESLNLDTSKYTFEYLAEELGFQELNEKSSSRKQAEKSLKKLPKTRQAAINAYYSGDEKTRKEMRDDTNKIHKYTHGKTASKVYAIAKKEKDPEKKKKLFRNAQKLRARGMAAKWNLTARDNEFAPEDTPGTFMGSTTTDNRKSPEIAKASGVEMEKVNASVEYTREELEALFETLNLDTNKYTFEFLAEELGFAAAEPIATSDAEPKVLKISLGNKEVYGGDSHEQAEEVEEVLVEGMRGRPSFKSLRVAPKGSTVVDKNGKLEKIKKLQKKG